MSAPDRKILVVDDEPFIGETLHRMLRRRFEVSVVADGRRGLTMLEVGIRFDVVICDLMMAPLGGAEVYAAARASVPHMADRFLIMTGGAYVKSVEEFLASWPHPVLLKPFTAKEVERAVVNTLARVELSP